MKLFRFDANIGKVVEQFGSSRATHSRIVRTSEAVRVDCIYLGAGGVLGYHPAVQNQLFVVVQGNGWARGQDEKRILIKAGQAAFWEAGEYHESGTDDGLTAIVIEGDGLDPALYMIKVDDGH